MRGPSAEGAWRQMLCGGAGWIARDGAAIEQYATTFDDTAEIPFGLGCGGTVDLMFEPVGRPEGEALLRGDGGVARRGASRLS